MKGADKVFVDLMNRQTMKVCTEGQENSDIYGDLRIRDWEGSVGDQERRDVLVGGALGQVTAKPSSGVRLTRGLFSS